MNLKFPWDETIADAFTVHYRVYHKPQAEDLIAKAFRQENPLLKDYVSGWDSAKATFYFNKRITHSRFLVYFYLHEIPNPLDFLKKEWAFSYDRGESVYPLYPLTPWIWLTKKVMHGFHVPFGVNTSIFFNLIKRRTKCENLILYRNPIPPD